MIIDEYAEEEDQSDGWVRGREVSVELSQRGHRSGGGDVSSIYK